MTGWEVFIKYLTPEGQLWSLWFAELWNIAQGVAIIPSEENLYLGLNSGPAVEKGQGGRERDTSVLS